MKIIETTRLYLREFKMEDAEKMFQLNLDTDVIKYTGDVPFTNVEEASEFIKNYDHYKKYGFGRWVVIRKNDAQFLGWCGLKFSSDENEYDIGFRFFKKYWNNGYATESAKACLNYGFETLNLTSIVGRSRIENKASIQVLHKIGLTFHSYFNFEGNIGVKNKVDKKLYLPTLKPN